MIDWFFSLLDSSIADHNRYWRFNYSVVFFIFSIPVLILITSGLYATQKHLNQSAVDEARFAAYPIAIALDQQLDEMIRSGETLATNPHVKSSAQSQDWNLKIYSSLSNESFIDGIFIADTQGIAQAVIPQAQDILGKDFSYREWYKNVTATNQSYVSPVYERANSPQYKIIAVAIPIFGNDQLLHGILGIQVRLDHFLEWLQILNKETKTTVSVTDKDGQLVAKSRDFLPQGQITKESNDQILAKIKAGQRGVYIGRSIQTKRQTITAFEPVPKFGWGVILEHPAQLFLSQRSDFMTQILLLCGILFLFHSIIIFLTLRAILYYPALKRQ
jgi:hypothetical protein